MCICATPTLSCCNTTYRQSTCRRRHGRKDSLRDKRPMEGILDRAMPARMVMDTELVNGQAPITSPVGLQTCGEGKDNPREMDFWKKEKEGKNKLERKKKKQKAATASPYWLEKSCGCHCVLCLLSPNRKGRACVATSSLPRFPRFPRFLVSSFPLVSLFIRFCFAPSADRHLTACSGITEFLLLLALACMIILLFVQRRRPRPMTLVDIDKRRGGYVGTALRT